MSGGVDSSVAAARLVEAGDDVTGVTLKLWGGPSDSGCCSVADVEDARRVAAQLDIPHYVFNFTDVFESEVVTPFVAETVAGRTPNPCVTCNRTMKFGHLLARARALGFDQLATGHHARLARRADGRLALRRGVDPAKDQSYVLARLHAADLEQCRFPIGDLTKTEVRREAERLGLRTAAKAESMDLCFVGRTGRAAFVAARAGAGGARPGAIVDTDGNVVGRHDGATAFTVGQRRGVSVAVGERRYVLAVEASTATVTIGRREELLRDRVELRDLELHAPLPRGGDPLVAQVRAHGDALDVTLDGTTVHFERPQPRVAPGQVVALYDADVLVGAGFAA